MPSAPTPLDSEETLDAAGTTGLIGYRLRRAQLNVFQHFLREFEALSLRPAEYSVLVLIADNPGRKQTAIAAALGIKRANFVTLARGLDDRGLIERRPVAGDGRANALHLTAAGADFLATARAVHEKMEHDLVAQLGGPAARDTLLGLLDRLA
jgi:DNA-binding MarR family transcriptional regulator